MLTETTNAQDTDLAVPQVVTQGLLRPAPRDSLDAETNNKRHDGAQMCNLHIHSIRARMTAERKMFFDSLAIAPDDKGAWLGALVLYMARENDRHRREILEELRGIARRTHDLDIISTLRQTFTDVTSLANGIRSQLSMMVQVFTKNRHSIPVLQREQLRIQFDYVRSGISACVTQEREARSHLRDMQPALAVLALAQVDFEALLTSIPQYSTNRAIENRLSGVVNTLREAMSEGAVIYRKARISLEKNTRHLSGGTSLHNKDTPIADHASLRGDIQLQHALQSEALAAIQLELDAARSPPLAMQTSFGLIFIDDLREVVPKYRLLQEELEATSTQQAELRESLAQASLELLTAIFPFPPAYVSA